MVWEQRNPFAPPRATVTGKPDRDQTRRTWSPWIKGVTLLSAVSAFGWSIILVAAAVLAEYSALQRLMAVSSSAGLAVLGFGLARMNRAAILTSLALATIGWISALFVSPSAGQGLSWLFRFVGCPFYIGSWIVWRISATKFSRS